MVNSKNLSALILSVGLTGVSGFVLGLATGREEAYLNLTSRIADDVVSTLSIDCQSAPEFGLVSCALAESRLWDVMEVYGMWLSGDLPLAGLVWDHEYAGSSYEGAASALLGILELKAQTVSAATTRRVPGGDRQLNSFSDDEWQAFIASMDHTYDRRRTALRHFCAKSEQWRASAVCH